MDKKEYLEAERELKRSIALIDDIDKEIAKAKDWGIVDILGGSGISSLLKRGKINNINDYLLKLRYQMQNTQRELVPFRFLTDIEIPNSFADNFFDIGFDNVFSDISTQDKLRDTEMKLMELRYFLQKVLDKVQKEG